MPWQDCTLSWVRYCSVRQVLENSSRLLKSEVPKPLPGFSFWTSAYLMRSEYGRSCRVHTSWRTDKRKEQ